MKSLFSQGRLSLILLLLIFYTAMLQAQPGGWSVNPSHYQYNMTVVAQLKINGIPNHDLNNHLAVFSQGQIRGYASATSFNGLTYYFLSVFSNVYQGDTLYFRAFIDADQKIYESTDTLIFRHQKSVGRIADPFMVNLFLGDRPLIYSVSEVNYLVNSCPDVVDVQASDNQDSEGNGLTYSIVGGADAAKFNINPQSGVVSWFNFTPSLSPPGDANGDNNYLVTVKVTDSSGQFDIQYLTVTVVPTAPLPPLVCPDNLSLLTSADGIGDCGATTDQATMYALVPCALYDLTYQLSGATMGSGNGQVPLTQSFLKGQTNVQYIRGGGSPSQCSFTVSVADNELPLIDCPADKTVETEAAPPCAATVFGIDAVFSDNCASAALTYQLSGTTTGTGNGQLSGQVFPEGVTIVTYTVTDAVNLSATCQFTITVEDMTPPVAICQNATVQLDANGMASVTAADINNNSSDACGIATLSVSPSNFTCAHVGDNTVTLTVIDVNGNSATCTATVTVNALSLGNLVYHDMNRNGFFDAGDTGVNGVVCHLYEDDGDGVLDAGDGEPLASFSTTTLNSQAGSFLFRQLCPGNYIVEIAPSNFNPGGSLYDNGLMAALVSSPVGGAPDPDNDLDGDDNGDAVAGFGVASAAVTLALAQEPIDDGDTDNNTNGSLDFGFKTPASVSVGDVTQSEGTGGATTAFQFTVTRSDNLDAFSLTVNSGNGTAVSPIDFTPISNGTVNFTAGGSLTATVTVLVNHDNMVEADETFTLLLTQSSGAIIIADASGLGTILNDDNAVVTLSGGISQSEGATFTFTATLNNPVQGGFSVEYTTSDGSATMADSDFTDNDGSLVFAGTAGETQTFTVNTTADNKVELNENFTTALGAISGAHAGLTTAGSPQTATITNDDAATVAIAANISQAEALTPQTYSVTLSNPVDVSVTVQFSTVDGTATTVDNDYTGIAGQTVTFATGTTTAQTVNVAIINDNKVEADEVYNASIGTLNASGRNVSLGVNTRTGTIINDDNAVVTLSGGIAQNEGNSGTTPYVFTATLNNPVQGGFNANYATIDGTATTADLDYVDNDGALVFAGTAGEVKTFTVQVNGDLTTEADETFQTTINSLSGVIMPGVVTISGSPQTGTITNDEQDWGDAPSAAQSGFANSYPTLAVNNGARHAVALGGLHLGSTIDGDLDGQPNANATGDGGDEDGVTLPAAIVINNTADITVNASGPGNLNAWIDFNRDGDWGDAGEQIFTNQAVVAGNNVLSFAVPTASLGSTFARFRIATAAGLSFDGPAADGEVEDVAIEVVNTQFSINDPSNVEGNAGTSNLTFTITRTNNTSACSVNYAITGGTSTIANNDYQVLAAGTVSFPAGGSLTQTVSVVVNGDNTVELDETVEITLSNPVNGSILDGLGVGTITNDDAAVLTINNVTLAEGDAATMIALFTLSMSNPSDATVKVQYSTVDGTATLANNDFQDTNGNHTFTPGQTTKQVVVPIVGDCSIETNETFLLRLSTLVNNGRNISFSGGGATLDGTATINNDDALPVLTCPANIIRNVDQGFCTVSVTLPLPTLSSICGTAILEFRYRLVDKFNVPLGPFTNYAPSGSNTVVFSRSRYEIEWRVSDGSGSSVCSFFLDVIDNQPPVIFCPANQTRPAGSTCSGTVGFWSPTFVGDNCTPTASIIVTQSPPPNTILSGHNASVVVTLTADDGGNTASCSFTVTLKDVTPPVARCKNATIGLGSTGNVTVPPATVDNVSTDNCGFTLSLTPNQFNCTTLGLKIVTLKATDVGGNTATCTARLTIIDNSTPTALCKNPTIFLDNTGHATLTVAQVDNGSTDACGIATRSLSRTDFNCADIQTSSWPVTLTLTDVNGNTSSCLSTVTVKDNIAPTAVCENVTAQLGSNGRVTVYPASLADNSYDNCSVWSYSPTTKLYTTANIGNNNLTITVKDWSNNVATCVSVVTVIPFMSSGDFQQGGGDKGDFSLFPNPAFEEVTLAFQLPAEQAFLVRVFDMAGRMIYSRAGMGEHGENFQLLILDGIDFGVYIVDFQSNDLKAQKRLVIQE